MPLSSIAAADLSSRAIVSNSFGERQRTGWMGSKLVLYVYVKFTGILQQFSFVSGRGNSFHGVA